MRSKDSGTNHVLVNLWSTRKLTGWLASHDLRQPYTKRILIHRKASPHALFDVLGLDGGRGKTMNDLVDRDRELPANKRDPTHVPDSEGFLLTIIIFLAKQAQQVHTASQAWQHARVVSSLVV